MSARPVVSILTPVYNGERYLEECIQSVLRQTYSDWEYVIFDNVSRDGTLAIAQRFASQDSRIRVIHATEFRGIYGNHNRALQAIDRRSRYCKIVHADDWLYPECLEQMVALAEANPSVGLVTAYRLYGTHVDLDGVFTYLQTVIPGREALRRAMLGKAWRTWVTGSPTSLLLRTDLLREQPDFYDERFWHADTDAAFRVLTHTDLGFVYQVLTFTRSHPGALTSFTDRVNSFKPEEGRLVLRYGPKVLNSHEYRKRLRCWLAAYGWYLAKQTMRPARLRDQEFYAFHRDEMEYLLAEAAHDREARAVLAVYRQLLRKPVVPAHERAESPWGQPTRNSH